MWALLTTLSATVLLGEDEHPWVGIANASIYPQRLLNHWDEHGWSNLRMSVFKDAKYAYERRLPVAERLLYTFLWIDLMYEAESEYVTEWVDNMGKVKRLHANIPAQIPFYKGVLGERLSNEFLRYFFSRGDLMRAGLQSVGPFGSTG